MSYHIDTGLIKEKFKTDCECPLCEIKKVAEEQFLHEFLNDAVMADDCRVEVGKKGFCAEHFDKLFVRQNKLSVALQMQTRMNAVGGLFDAVNSVGQAKKRAKEIEKSLSGCVICDLLEESMVKYYKTIAQLFAREREFFKTLHSSKGFCMRHYAELLKYASCAGFMTKEYLKVLSSVQKRNFDRLGEELGAFCVKHDYRNANVPLGSAETALPRVGEKFYGKKN